MKITNKQKDAKPSNITLNELGKAMSQVDLTSVPPEKIQHAVFDQFMRVMEGSIQCGETAYQIKQSRKLRAKLGKTL